MLDFLSVGDTLVVQGTIEDTVMTITYTPSSRREGSHTNNYTVG